MHVCTISSRRTGKTASALPPLTAPAYVRLRREAAGMTVDQLARALVLVAAHGWAAKRLTLEEGRLRHRRMLDHVRLIECDGSTVRHDATLRQIQSVMPFDPAVYRALADTPAGDHPRVCRGCGCSDHDACVTESPEGEHVCSLVTRDVCSRCLRKPRPGRGSGMTALTSMRSVRSAGGEVRHVPTPYIPPAQRKKAKKRHVPDPMVTRGNEAAEELRMLLERAERIDEEIEGLQDDKSDVFAEAKGRGWSDKAMREILKIRKQKKEEFQENAALLETYMISLGML